MTTSTDTLAIPASLKRETNARGVTLSAGIEKPATVTASKVPAVGPEKPADPKAVKAIKARKPKFTGKRKIETDTQPKVEAAPKSTPVTSAPALQVVDGEVQPIEKVSRSIVPMKFKARYSSKGGTCGDDMALELKAATTTLNADKRETLDVEALWTIAKVNEIDVAKYLNLNNGQKRMNVGNKLRGLLNQGKDVVVGGRTFKAEDHTPRH